MVFDGMSTQYIRNYLNRWVQWWVNTTGHVWNKNGLVQQFCKACFDITPAAYAAGLLLPPIRESHSSTAHAQHGVLDTLRLGV